MELLEPVKRVVNEEFADVPAVLIIEIDGVPPGCEMAFREERARISREVISRRSEVIVDDIDEHHETKPMGAIDQALELIAARRRRIGRKGQHAVISPVPGSRKFGDAA